MGASEPSEYCGAVDAREGGHCFWVEIEACHEPVEVLGAGVYGCVGFHSQQSPTFALTRSVVTTDLFVQALICSAVK